MNAKVGIGSIIFLPSFTVRHRSNRLHEPCQLLTPRALLMPVKSPIIYKPKAGAARTNVSSQFCVSKVPQLLHKLVP